MFTSFNVTTKTVIGVWETIDDETNKAKSHVKVYKAKNGKIYGKVIKIIDPKKQDAVCSKCDDDDSRKDQKIMGMLILKHLVKDGDEYDDGEILDPAKGKTYDCKIWLDEDDKDVLKVRGYIGFLYRTQTWNRVNNN
jgi:uncharacterized protein (DUF2147 family)